MKRRSGGFDKAVLLLILIVVVALSTVVFLYLQLRTDEITDDIQKGNPINCVFLVSSDGELLFSELLLYHPETEKAAIFDIPTEWGDVIESLERMDRISVLYEYGNPRPFVEKLEQLLATNIEYWVEMDLSDVERLVDVLEGIEVFIPNPIERISDERLVLLPSGSLVLDGAKTRLFISYEDPDETDVERRGRHQKFLQATLKRLSERTDYVLNDTVFDFIRAAVKTNMSRRATEAFIRKLRTLNADHLVSKYVPGTRQVVDDQVLLFPHFEGQHVRESVRQTVDSLASTDVVSLDELSVVLEILNGTTRNGLAGRTRQLFESFGYDVRTIGNASRNDYERTQIISRSGNLAAAQRIADIIRCTDIVTDPEDANAAGTNASHDTIDITILLGSDFDGRYCK